MGQHRYEITYRTTRQIGFFAEYDELYWNVTGNGWTFPIERGARDDPPARAARGSCSMRSIPAATRCERQ